MILQTAYYVAATITVYQCYRLADQIGRKPVLLIGVLGLSVSMCVFGLSTTFWALLLCQFLMGALNGTTGVIKSMVVEITDSTNVARACGYVMVGWFVANSLGPAIGGSLSRPADQFPQRFGSSEFFKKYAYFLPCAVCSAFLFTTWMFGFAALEETKEKSILVFPVKREIRKDTQPREVQEGDNGSNGPPLPLRAILTSKVISATVNYGALSIVAKAYSAIHPVFLSTPIPDGGLGLAPRAIGTILSVIAIFTGLCQFSIFPCMHNKLGSRNVFILSMLTTFLTFILWPIVNWIARTGGYSGFLWFALALQGMCTIVTQMGFGAVLILISESPRNRACLSSLSSFVAEAMTTKQMVANVVRAPDPGIFNSLFSLSVDNGYLGGQLVYVVTTCIAAIALYMASWSPRVSDR